MKVYYVSNFDRIDKDNIFLDKAKAKEVCKIKNAEIQNLKNELSKCEKCKLKEDLPYNFDRFLKYMDLPKCFEFETIEGYYDADEYCCKKYHDLSWEIDDDYSVKELEVKE